MRPLKQVLMERDGLSEEEANREIRETQNRILELVGEGEFEDAFDEIETSLGLEPDYLEEVLYA